MLTSACRCWCGGSRNCTSARFGCLKHPASDGGNKTLCSGYVVCVRFLFGAVAVAPIFRTLIPKRIHTRKCPALSSTSLPRAGPITITHVATIHNECAAQIRPWPTRGACGGVWSLVICRNSRWRARAHHPADPSVHLPIDMFSFRLTRRHEQCQVACAPCFRRMWHPQCLFRMDRRTATIHST